MSIEKLTRLLEVFEEANSLLLDLECPDDFARMHITYGDIRHQLQRYSRVVNDELHYAENEKLAEWTAQR